jgi:acyl-CoA reductase-like NAD-dependent aldehyde dehydrogenase
MENIQRLIDEALGYQSTGEPKPVYSPYNGVKIADIPQAGRDTIFDKIDALSSTSKISLQKRINVINEYQNLIRKNFQKYAMIASNESGIPIIDMAYRISRTDRDPSEYARNMFGENWKELLEGNWIEGSSKKGKVYRRILPNSVYLDMSPNNDSVGVFLQTFLELYLSGNKTMSKPGSSLPVAHTILAGEIQKMTPEYLNIITGSGSEIPYIALENENLDGIVFTGESRHGRLVNSAAVAKGVKFFGEFEGSNAQIVCQDYDIDKAALYCAHGARAFNGIACANAPHISFEDKSKYKIFKNKIIELGETFNKTLGQDPTSPNTLLGPLVTEKLAERCEKIIDAARENGYEILTGGSRKGNFVDFTVIEGQCYRLAEHIKDEDLKDIVKRGRIAGPLLFIDNNFEDTIEWLSVNGRGREGLALRNNILTKDTERLLRLSERLGSAMNTNNIYYFALEEGWAGRCRSSTLRGEPLIKKVIDYQRVNDVPDNFNPFEQGA